MSSLKEIKGRIASVQNTLKITSAMKMVSSAKLHKVQSSLGNMDSYRSELMSVLSSLLSGAPVDSSFCRPNGSGRVVLVCMSSNSSLCGSFNANAVRRAVGEIERLKKNPSGGLYVVAAGKKMAESLKRHGLTPDEELHELVAKPDYDSVCALADRLYGDFSEGRSGKVRLVYNHHRSMAVQVPVSEDYLPLALDIPSADISRPEYIFEPDARELLSDLLPKVLRINLYSVILDTVCAEHAARMVAMQTASDNAEKLLQELHVQYNKSRQQKITNEILDIVCGSSAKDK